MDRQNGQRTALGTGNDDTVDPSSRAVNDSRVGPLGFT
jgi:hypothetical protein